MGGSNESARDTTFLVRTEELALAVRVFLIGFEPVLILVGLIGNALVLIIMPRKTVMAAKSAKFYYMLLAFADLMDIIIGWLLRSFISETMYIYTNGSFHFELYKQSSFTCKLFFGLWTFFETISDYTLVAMGIERIIALWYRFLKFSSIFSEIFR